MNSDENLSRNHYSLHIQLQKIADIIHSFSSSFVYLLKNTNILQPKGIFLGTLSSLFHSTLSYRLLTYDEAVLGYIVDVKEIGTRQENVCVCV